MPQRNKRDTNEGKKGDVESGLVYCTLQKISSIIKLDSHTKFHCFQFLDKIAGDRSIMLLLLQNTDTRELRGWKMSQTYW